MEQAHESDLHRWGVYSGSRLAFAGIARPSGAGKILVRFIEAEHLAQTTTLPQRIELEHRIREFVRSDIRHALGPNGKVCIDFEPRKLSEDQLAAAIFRMPQPRTLSGS